MSYHRRVATSVYRCRTIMLSSGVRRSQQLLWNDTSSSILRVASLQQQQQCRSIFSYIAELFRTNKDDKSENPILAFLNQEQQLLPSLDKPISRNTATDYENKKHEGATYISGNHATTTVSTPSAATTAVVGQPNRSMGQTTFPNFTTMKPNHVQDAYEYVQQEQLRLLKLAVDDVQTMDVMKNNDNHHHSGILQKFDSIVRWIDTIQQSFYTLRQITSFMGTIVVTPTSSIDDRQRKQMKGEWYDAIQSLQATSQNHTGGPSSTAIHITFPIVATTTTTTDATPSISTAILWQKLHVTLYEVTRSIEQLQSSPSSSSMVLSDHDRSNLYASQYILKNYIHETGDDPTCWLLDESDESTKFSVEQEQYENTKKRYNELSNILTDIRSNILEIESTSVSLSSVKLIYSYLGIRTEQVKLLGYHTVADQIFGNSNGQRPQFFQRSTTTDIGTVQQLHVDMTERLLPILRKITDKSRRMAQPKLALESYLTSSKSGSGLDATMTNQRTKDAPTSKYSIEQYKSDVRSMIRLEHHVTLEGALQFSFRLIHDIFGVSIVESSVDGDITAGNDTKWDSCVRLFHCYDALKHNKYIGSMYIDPFQRKEKMPRPATVPIVARSEHQAPIVCICLALEVPTWDTNPAMMTWDDCEALLHELGHGLQFMTAQSKHGCVLGPQSMPFDISELLPKV